ncbi:hypothetical protein BF49_5447 [Bradyrhizobium sp.]|nr:hypothetical protein BF49_5447 [Bradyrhizobium sp.]
MGRRPYEAAPVSRLLMASAVGPSAIAKTVKIGRTSVYRALAE